MTSAPFRDDAASPPPAALRLEAPLPPADDPFRRWVDGLGVVRADNWIGGVCAGLAARWGVDPVIVRGIAVVAAVIGLPAILLYAIAWALLPDASGRSHAVDLERGRFSYAQAAILATAVVGMLHGCVLLVAVAGIVFGSSSGAVLALLAGALLAASVVVTAAIVALVVRAARRRPGVTDETQRRASAASSGPAASADGSVADAPAGGTDAADAAVPPALLLAAGADPVGTTTPAPAPPAPAPLAPAPLAPAPPGHDAGPADVEAWRAQHAAWKERDRAWRREQDDADRAVRAIAREERRAAASVFAREAADRRRRRRLSRPRTSAAFAALAWGIAVVAGTIAAVTAPGRFAVAAGLFVAAVVIAAAMIVAGAVRRRSGFLAFVAVCTLIGGGVAVAVPTADDLNLGDRAISNGALAPSGTFTQFWGGLDIWIGEADEARPLVVDKGAGTTYVTLAPGVELSLRATVGSEATVVLYADDEWVSLGDEPDAVPLPGGGTFVATTLAPVGEPTTRQTLTLDQESGYIEIRRLSPVGSQREEIMP